MGSEGRGGEEEAGILAGELYLPDLVCAVFVPLDWRASEWN